MVVSSICNKCFCYPTTSGSTRKASSYQTIYHISWHALLAGRCCGWKKNRAFNGLKQLVGMIFLDYTVGKPVNGVIGNCCSNEDNAGGKNVHGRQLIIVKNDDFSRYSH